MNLFEYQGKKFFSDAGINVPKSILISSAEEIPEINRSVVVKPQVQIGGRGKAGAISICNTTEEVREAVGKLLKTPIKGHIAKKVLLEDKVNIKKEYYFSIFVNRKQKVSSMMFTDMGGMDIENVGEENIVFQDINPLLGLQDYMIDKLLGRFSLENTKGVAEVIKKCYALFTSKKMQLLEINPLVLTESGDIVALDAKVNLDDWAIDKSIDIKDQDAGDLTPFEKKFLEYQVTAVEMDGDIVVFGGGAGASMATADSIAARGGKVRAIIDVGTLPTDSTDPKVAAYAAEAMKTLLMLKPKVILINFYFQAGRLDNSAKTIKAAFADVSKTIPVVVRFKGRMAGEGLEILKDTSMYLTASYDEACKLALSKV
ncbi:MAG: ATP-grasp domain-containing protein [Clostridiaceae bacterium]|nr:ATP-grasp domain-containing protein [Clostridiaceae bacterium]